LDRRFTNIQSKLQNIQDQIDSKFKAMEDQMESKFQAAIENYMNDGKNSTNHFDRIHSDLEEIKKNTKSKGVSLFKGFQLTDLLENPIIQSLLSLDLSQIRDLLQNPLIQSLFADSKDNKNGSRKKKGKKSSGSSGLDLSLGNLLQNPMIQSLLK
jgi:hypothetical protein